MIRPRSAILQRVAASIVEGIFELMVSRAERIATFGRPIHRAWASAIAFCTISTLSSIVGEMFAAASVMNNGLAYVSTSRMKTWLTRLAVRMPISLRRTSAISSSVCRLPFINASPSPARNNWTAFSAAAWLWPVDYFEAADVEVKRCGKRRNSRLRSDQDWLDYLRRGCLGSRPSANGGRKGEQQEYATRRQCMAGINQCNIFSCFRGSVMSSLPLSA